MMLLGKSTFEERIAALMGHAVVHKPKHATGRLPVVIQLHGCGGAKRMQGDWAEKIASWGWAAVVVDSYAHRRIKSLQAYTTICTGFRFWGRERAGDMFAAMEWVRRQDWADADRIVVAGWSHGGWTVLDAMAMAPGHEALEATGVSGLPEEPLAGLAGAFLVYPFAGPGCLARTNGLRVDVSPTALVGGRDVIVGGKGLMRTLEEIATPGRRIDVTFLPTATHAFDERGARDLRVHYDATLTGRAHGLLKDYLDSVAVRDSAQSA